MDVFKKIYIVLFWDCSKSLAFEDNVQRLTLLAYIEDDATGMKAAFGRVELNGQSGEVTAWHHADCVQHAERSNDLFDTNLAI